MKAPISPAIEAHLIRSAFYLLLLLAVFVIPLALGQRSATNSAIDAAKIPAPELTPITLWQQYDNAGTAVTLSATFTDSPAINSDLADDFVVPVAFSLISNSVASKRA